MTKRFWVWLILCPVLWIVTSGASADAPTVGMTGWDLSLRLLNSVPTIIVAIGVVAWFMTKAFIAVIEFLQPERVQIRTLWERQDELANNLGYMLILVRELEGALEHCAKGCPDCKHSVDDAVERARNKARARGLLLPGDATVPGVAT